MTAPHNAEPIARFVGSDLHGLMAKYLAGEGTSHPMTINEFADGLNAILDWKRQCREARR